MSELLTVNLRERLAILRRKPKMIELQITLNIRDDLYVFLATMNETREQG